MKHWISFLLAVLLCLPFAASCKEKTPPQPGDGTATAGSPSTAPESENVTEIETDEYGREVLESALPENLRYDNDRITVMVRSSHEQWFVGVNDKKATAIQQALYARDRRVEDRLKVRLDIKPVTQTGSDTKNYDQTVRAALSGAGEYDIITSYAFFTPTLAISGCFADMNGIRNLHMDTLCWNSDFADSVVFDGALYFNVGDFSLDYLGKLTTVYFNKNLAARYFGSSDVIYDMVDDGSWTLGNVGALVKEIYTDLNSNGAQDIEDFYGFTMNAASGPCECLVSGIGFSYTSRDENGKYAIFKMDTALSDRIDAIHRFLKLEGCAPRAIWNWGKGCEAFKSQKTIFLCSAMDVSNSFLDVDFSYGFLPAMKYDEHQTRYYTGIGDSFSLQALMRNGADNERAGAVLQCLNETSYQLTTPEYFNVLLQGRYADEPNDLRMLELLRSTVLCDFGRIYSSRLSRITGGVWSNFCNPAADYATWYDTNSGTWEQNLKDLLEELRKGKTA